MDRDTAERVNAVAKDVMSAFRHTVELYATTPALVKAAGFDDLEDWVRGQPKPQITRGERREMALELRTLGLTQPQIAAVVGVDVRTVQREAIRPEKPTFVTPVREEEAPEKPTFVTPAPQKEGKPRSQRATVTDARRTIRSVQLTLAGMGPLDVVPDARPVLRAFAEWLIEWTSQWSENDASGAE